MSEYSGAPQGKIAVLEVCIGIGLVMILGPLSGVLSSLVRRLDALEQEVERLREKQNQQVA